MMEILITPDHTTITGDDGQETDYRPEQIRVVIEKDGDEHWVDIDVLVSVYVGGIE